MASFQQINATDNHLIEEEQPHDPSPQNTITGRTAHVIIRIGAEEGMRRKINDKVKYSMFMAYAWHKELEIGRY
ncbi:27695_t:CDS:2 [Dentiscutata erythropus]|uniref:27695_t:CDS:1 n=1 Tax=Dentiscutata erythropus TaxID=1348616 RepID=A0A9N9ALH4_9GLOM|nr:27695_t:CDS:2 [Dentiscutata erythropus]